MLEQIFNDHYLNLLQYKATIELNDFAREINSHGLLPVKKILNYGIQTGNVLEIDFGLGYLGMNWLKHVQKGHLTELRSHTNTILLAKQYANACGFAHATNLVKGHLRDMPFDENTFDGVISSGCLHKWKDPYCTLNEIYRVLRPNGIVLINDFKCNIPLPIKQFMKFHIQGANRKANFMTSVNNSYTLHELQSIASNTLFTNTNVSSYLFGLQLVCIKEY